MSNSLLIFKLKTTKKKERWKKREESQDILDSLWMEKKSLHKKQEAAYRFKCKLEFSIEDDL